MSGLNLVGGLELLSAIQFETWQPSHVSFNTAVPAKLAPLRIRGGSTRGLEIAL